MAQRDWAEKDFYKLLGVSKTATKDEIKKAYRKLAQKYHPDANKGDTDAEKRFKEISEAQAVLSNESKRKEYDQMRAFVESGGQRFYGFGPDAGGGNVRVNIGDLGDLFGDEGGLFEDLFGFRSRAPRRGADVETEVQLSFEDAMAGVTITLEDGTRVRIPPGMRDGGRIKVAGKGAPGPQGGERGDLYVRVRVEPHSVFTLGPNGNLTVRVPVTFPEAALGTQVEVPTLNGSVKVKIPPATPHGKVLRVKGQGAPRPKGGRGDLLVKVEVEVPQRLSKKEKEALEHFAEVHTTNPRSHLEQELRKTEVW
jgi:molecular chaperone DnaJ